MFQNSVPSLSIDLRPDQCYNRHNRSGISVLGGTVKLLAGIEEGCAAKRKFPFAPTRGPHISTARLPSLARLERTSKLSLERTDHWPTAEGFVLTASTLKSTPSREATKGTE